MIDCAAFIGPYPFRHVPHPDPEVLVRVLAREQLDGAWVGWLPAAWHRDPAPGNAALFAALEPHATLRATPVVRPDWPGWERALADHLARGAAAVRAWPMHWGLGAYDASMHALAGACAETGIPLLLTVRFEDLRQRHRLDTAGDLTAAHIRALARSAPSLRLVITAAGREMIEEVHWSLTPEEQGRVHWDFSWVWGPPEEHLAHLFQSMDPARFVYGTHWPLRLTQNPRANLDLLPDDLRHAGITDAASLARRA